MSEWFVCVCVCVCVECECGNGARARVISVLLTSKYFCVLIMITFALRKAHTTACRFLTVIILRYLCGVLTSYEVHCLSPDLFSIRVITSYTVDTEPKSVFYLKNLRCPKLTSDIALYRWYEESDAKWKVATTELKVADVAYPMEEGHDVK